MFPDSDIVAKFSLGKTKCRYMILFGLAPYFKNALIKDINNSLYYSLSFDKSLNSIVQKCQMDINIRYWDSKEKKVKTRYLDSQFLEQPNADNLLQRLKTAIKDLKEESILQLAIDRPNVNWEVLRKLDDTLVEDCLNKTLNIGSCAQHVIHGAFQTGSSKIEWQLDKVMKAMFSLFKDSPARQDVFKSVTGTDIFPLR